MLGWEITNSCNLHCPHCYNPEARQTEAELTSLECRRVLDAAAELGVKMIGWTGGEPLLRADLAELIEYAMTEHQINSGITTNGVLLDHERAVEFKKVGVAMIQISLDGTSPARSRRIRGTSDEEFLKVINAIRVCKELEIETHIAMLLGAENLDDGLEMVKLAKREGVAGIRFCGFTPEGRSKSDAIRRRFQFGEDLSRLHDFIEQVSSDDSLQTVFDPGFGPVPPDYWFHECVAGVATCYIKANGDVYPCTAMLYDRFVVGNVKRRSLVELWHDPAMTVMQSFPHDQIEGVCSVCDNADNCHGACRCLSYAHTGSLNESFPVCLYQMASATSS